MDLKLINLNVTKNFFDLDDLELAQHICSDVGVLNSYDDFSGKRCNIKNRYFITKKSPKEYCFFADKILKKFNQQDLVRIEVANDTNGFWLKPKEFLLLSFMLMVMVLEQLFMMINKK
jgi:hypothetical protein